MRIRNELIAAGKLKITVGLTAKELQKIKYEKSKAKRKRAEKKR